MPTNPVITWQELVQTPEVVGLGAALTSRYGIWVGLVTPAGTVLPLRGRRLAAGGPQLPVCEGFKRRGDTLGSCERSVMAWAQGRERGLQRCHAGLASLVEPVLVGELGHAALYASGFVEGERGAGVLPPVLERASSLGLDRSGLARELDNIPRLGARERDEVLAWLALMRTALERAVPTSAAPPRRRDYSNIVGQSVRILALFALLDRVVESDSTVLIHGENGTGKELFARAIHTNSRRADRAFVSQNCAALNDNLLESELFGHKRGAFTGAISDKRGLFELADGGTLFLDEVGDMSPSMQVKLLRVLQERAFVPVGDAVTHKVDVRVIAASNRDLSEMVSTRGFREDLFYRLNVITLRVPALRERREDIPMLVEHFARDYARRTGAPRKRVGDEAMRLLGAWEWPGNVRELRHEVERLYVLSGEVEHIEAALISPRIREGADPYAPRGLSEDAATLPKAVEALERRMILHALDETGWNKTHAAQQLGISRRNLIRKVQAWGLESEDGA